MQFKNEILNWFKFDIWLNVSLPEDVDQSLSINDFLQNFRFRDSGWGTLKMKIGLLVKWWNLIEENKK